MKRTNSLKKAFAVSVLSTIACLCLLIGSTFAWFTSTVTSSNNKIVAGNLDVALVMWDGSEYKDISNQSGAIFGSTAILSQNQTIWEPGKTEIAFLGVKNKGSLALQYNIVLDVSDGGLVGSLEYAIVDGAQPADLTGVTNWTQVKTAAGSATGDVVAGKFVAASDGCLDEITNGELNETDYFALAIHMKETAGNEYQGKDITIDVKVIATQVTSESDAFDKDYDKDADTDYILQADGSWTGRFSSKLLAGTDKPYATVVVNGQPTTIVSLDGVADGVYAVGAGSITVSGKNVSYTNTGAAQEVVIRTGSYETILTIDAGNDYVKHFGQAFRVDIIAVAMSSYHEFGDILGNINLTKGNVVVEQNSKASAVVIDMTASELASVTTISANNSLEPSIPIILNTSEELWDVNPHNELINPDTNNIIYANLGGTVPSNMDSMTLVEKEAAIAAVSDFQEGAVAVDDVTYNTFLEGWNACKANQTIRLLKDYAYSSSPTYLYKSFNYTIDLNGHALNLNNSSYGLYVLNGKTTTINDSQGTGSFINKQCVCYVADGGKLIINGGHLCGTVSDSTAIWCYGEIAINGGCIDSGRNYGIILGNYNNNGTPATLSVTGGTLNGGVYINGQDTENNIINISGGTLNDCWYLAGNSITTITGGSFISSSSCIYLKSGQLNISGGLFHSSGDKIPFSHVNSGAGPTGDAIVIESCSYPGGNPVAQIIEGATIISDHASKIGCYVYDDATNPLYPIITIQADEYSYYKVIKQADSEEEGIKVQTWKIYNEEDELIQTDVQKEDTFYTNSAWNGGLGTSGQKNCSLEYLLKGSAGNSIATGEGMKLRCNVVLTGDVISPATISKGENFYLYLCGFTITGGKLGFAKNITIYSDTDNLESLFTGGTVVKTDNGNGTFTYVYTVNSN